MKNVFYFFFSFSPFKACKPKSSMKTLKAAPRMSRGSALMVSTMA